MMKVEEYLIIRDHVDEFEEAAQEAELQTEYIVSEDPEIANQFKVTGENAIQFFRLGFTYMQLIEKSNVRDMMLVRLARSENENARQIANDILSKKKTVKQELKYAGGFMTEVLKGNFDEALAHADHMNRRALLRAD